MQNLARLLERFTKSLNKDALTKEAIALTIGHRIGLQLSPESFTIKDGVLSISASAVAKNEMRMKEESILAELRAQKVPVSRILYK